MSLLDLTLLGAAVLLVIVAVHRLGWICLQVAMKLLHALPQRITGTRTWVRALSLESALQQRFPRAYPMIAGRFTVTTFVGLPLTLLVAAASYIAMLLGGLVQELLEAEDIVRIDEAVNDWFAGYRVSPLVDIFLWLTDLGGSAALLGVVTVASGFLWAHRRPGFVLPLLICFLGTEFTTWSGKFVLGRHRPDFVTAATALSPSFPSAHAAGATAVYGFLAYILSRDLPDMRERYEIAYWSAILIGLIGFSRVFLSVHYLSDVAAGVLVGGFWLLTGFALAEWLRYSHPRSLKNQ